MTGSKRKETDKRKRPLPTKDAPFDVDPNDDGDMASPKPELEEDDLKEMEDRRG